MAGNLLAVFVSSLLLLSISAYGDNSAPEKRTEVVVEGVVYCQSCDNFGSWSLSKAEPIPAAKVSVICKNDDNDQVRFYKSYQTDGNGYFYAELDGFQVSNSLLDHPLQSCKVKLVSSPREDCNLLSNVNYGINGSPLRYENKVLHRKDYDVVVYAAGPVAFRPASCPAPTQN